MVFEKQINNYIRTLLKIKFRFYKSVENQIEKF